MAGMGTGTLEFYYTRQKQERRRKLGFIWKC